MDLVAVDAVERASRGRQPHHERPQLDELAGKAHTHASEVDLDLVAERVVLGGHHRHGWDRLASLGSRDVAARGRLGQLLLVLVDQALEDPPLRVVLLGGRSRSASSNASIVDIHGLS